MGGVDGWVEDLENFVRKVVADYILAREQAVRLAERNRCAHLVESNACGQDQDIVRMIREGGR